MENKSYGVLKDPRVKSSIRLSFILLPIKSLILFILGFVLISNLADAFPPDKQALKLLFQVAGWMLIIYFLSPSFSNYKKQNFETFYLWKLNSKREREFYKDKDL